MTRVLPILALFFTLATAARAQVNLPINARPSPGKDCAICHLEWNESFTLPGRTTLMDAPARPTVADNETCLGCHDGSVDDDRREVWLEHSHKTGIAPSAEMKVPANLPLDDGKLACRTCHTAHSAAGAGFADAVAAGNTQAAMRDTFFLRVKNDNGQLCLSCHSDKSKGPDAGSHPLVAMPDGKKLPPSLLAAGSHGGPNNDKVVCQSCHTAHGSKEDHLLVMATTSSQLCSSCHDTMRPAMWKPQDAHAHSGPLPITNPVHLQAIKDMKTKVGDGNTLVCLSCHKVHDGHAGKAMLADTLVNSSLCIRCHTDRADMVDTKHDLRKVAPTELNKFKQPPAESGLCGSCHTFHSYTRELTPTPADPQGLCTTCHSEGQIAAKHGSILSHPANADPTKLPKDAKPLLFPSKDDPTKMTLACQSCHDPHTTKQSHFLRTSGDALCQSCHTDKAKTMAGPHDFTKKPELLNARGKNASQSGSCGFCHAVHEANGPKLWIATKDVPKTADDLCASCHKEAGLASAKPVAAFNHPTGEKAKPTNNPHLPLHDGGVSCASCHDPHGNNAPASLLRANTATDLCVQCHTDQAKMAGGPHDPRQSTKPLPAGMKKQADLCTSCHQPHSNDADKRRWAVAPSKQEGLSATDATCAGCHSTHAPLAGGVDRSTSAGPLMHPLTLPAEKVAHVPAGFPLAKSHADAAVADTMMCKTCHDPHARPATPQLLRLDLASSGNRPADLCTSCHDHAKHNEKGMHAASFFPPKPDAKPNVATGACAPCHSTHAVEGTQRELLWSAPMNKTGLTRDEQLCLGCHSPKGGARTVQTFQHPVTAMKQVRPTTLPATTPTSRVATSLPSAPFPIDKLTCSNCHLPHAREFDAAKHEDPLIDKAILSGIKPMLKPDVDQQVCATCHGFDAKRVYLYYHNPKKRAQVKQLLQP